MRNDVVAIKLDKPRFLRYGHKALKKLSALTGKTLDELGAGEFDIETLEIVLYCGLISDDKNLQLSDMEDILDEAESYQAIIDSMTKAFNLAFGNHGEQEKN